MNRLLLTKCIALLGAVCLTCLIITPLPVSAVGISAKAAILMDAKTGEVIYEKNSSKVLQMASTTKIMSTLLCLEKGNLDEKFVVDPNAIKVEGSSMGLTEGDIVSRRDLCYGMMLPSGNDAANATAVSVSGSLDAFAKKMNEKAKKIGMKNTHFVTPSGLDDDTDDHYSTAYDMALLTKEALKNKTFRKICSSKNAKVEFGNPPFARWLYNTNRLLGSYEGVIGVKTGFTDKAKRCLVSACERDGVSLIAVTLNAPSDWNDHRIMYDYGFSIVEKVPVRMEETKLSVNVVGGDADVVSVVQEKPVVITKYNDEKKELQKRIYIPQFVYAPVKKGDVVGRVDYYMDEKFVQSIPIIASESINQKIIKPKKTIIDRILSFFHFK